MAEEKTEKQTMNIDFFVADYCGPTCDRGGEIDCCCSLDGSCAKSRAMNIELIDAAED